MEEKLNEILEQAEIKLISYEKDVQLLNSEIEFLMKHKFYKELDHVKTSRNSKVELFEDYRETVRKTRDLLNKWNS